MWAGVKRIIRRSDNFVIATHVYPDGDAIGSALALAQILRDLGKKVLVVNQHPVPQMYKFLDPNNKVRVWNGALARRVKKSDVIFVVDVSSFDRLGEVGSAVKESRAKTICIDHHKTNDRFAEINIIEDRSASTGELIYSLGKSLQVTISRRIANALFTAIATDTGWFRFSNTSALVLERASELAAMGAKADRLYESIYENMAWPRMALLERILSTLHAECDGKIACMHATKQMFAETGASSEDTEGFIDFPRSLRDVQIIIFLREIDGKVKVSMRSKSGGPAVDKIAKALGGGGHRRAAGILLRCPLDEAEKAVVKAASSLFPDCH